MTRRSDTKAQKDMFILHWMTHNDPGRAYREAGLIPDTKARDGNGKSPRSHTVARDKRNGLRLLKDPYVEGVIANIRQQHIDKLTDDADATRHEIMSGYRKVLALAIGSERSRELNAAVRALDGMARMMGYLIEHKIIHHERSDKQIERMSSSDELNMFIKSVAIELGPATMRLLVGETAGGGNGEIIDVGTNSTDRGSTEAGEEAGSGPAESPDGI